MRNVILTLTALAGFGSVAVAGLMFWPLSQTPPERALAPDWQPAPGAGEYAMRAGDCYACHTADGGAAFAGGRPIESPLGRIYTANITPDPETGIGGYSLDQFRAALIDGQRGDGAHLYPAMPYENYRMLTEEDIRALYAYFQTEVTAVQNVVAEPELPFPFNQRWGLRALNWLLLRHDPGHRATMGDPRLDRGQYLVDAPGHCAACHSPRTVYMGQNGLTRGDPDYLTGGVIDGWKAPPLRGAGSALQRWTLADLADFLATGRNSHSTANGEMALVVDHSLQYLTAPDILAMAGYLKALDGPVAWPEVWPAQTYPQVEVPRPARPEGEATWRALASADPALPLGARLYLDNCSACHFVTGQGSPGVFPALDGNSLVTSEEAHPLIDIMLNGAEVPGTALRPMSLVMQGYRERLSDAEIAELASFLRQGWGNSAAAISPDLVRDIREETAE